MKIIIYTLLSIVILQSCGLNEKVSHRRYVLENETKRKVKVEFYNYGRFDFADSINGKGILTENIINDANGKHLAAVAAYHFADSAIVTFDDERFLKYIYEVHPDNQNNILSDSAYVIESNELYLYTFTEEDYENAELIEE